MPRKPKNVKVEKLSLKALLGKEKGPEAELYSSGDPDREKNHKKYRTPRDAMVNSNGMGYTRSLASSPATDARYHELAREFVNNGLNATKAYATVYGTELAKSWLQAEKIFSSTWMKAKVREILLGTGEGYEELPKEYLLERLVQMIDSNVLDYIADDGTVLSVSELKALPGWTQTLIKSLEVVNTTRLIAVKDENGVVIKMDNGQPHFSQVTDQRVKIELYDKLKAMDTLAKAMRWITSNTEINVTMITPDMMVRANARVKQLGSDASEKTIEGTAKRVTAN